MGCAEEAAKKTQIEASTGDADWFVERIASLAAELKIVKGPIRASYIRVCMRSAIRCHSQLMSGATVSTNDDDY